MYIWWLNNKFQIFIHIHSLIIKNKFAQMNFTYWKNLYKKTF